MFLHFLADFVVVFHLACIVYGLFGGLLFFWRRWSVFLHLPFALWVSLIEFQHWICPLTPLENYLSELGGAPGYNESYVEHYLVPVIYPPGLTEDTQVVLGCIALGINLLIYALVLRSMWTPRKRNEEAP